MSEYIYVNENQLDKKLEGYYDKNEVNEEIDKALAALGGVRISAKQTYSGGGYCDNYLHLDFDFSPKLMFICGGGCSAVFVRDTDKAFVCGPTSDSDGGAHYCELVWGEDNSVWWRSDTVMSQFNLSGKIYTAYAIG